jgi:predicted secreted hydrolase
VIDVLEPVRLPRDEFLHLGWTHEWWYFFADLEHATTGDHYHYTSALMRHEMVWVSYVRWWRAGDAEPVFLRQVHQVREPPPHRQDLTIAPVPGAWQVTINPGRYAHRVSRHVTLRFRDRGRGACLLTSHQDRGIRRYGGKNVMAWYAWPWLEVRGRLGTEHGETTALHGHGWMEHQWGNTDFRRLNWRYLPVLLSSGERLVAFAYRHAGHPNSETHEVAWLRDGALQPVESGRIAPIGPGGLSTTVTAPGLDLRARSWPNANIDLRLPVLAPHFFEGPSVVEGSIDGEQVSGHAMTEYHPIT